MKWVMLIALLLVACSRSEPEPPSLPGSMPPPVVRPVPIEDIQPLTLETMNGVVLLRGERLASVEIILPEAALEEGCDAYLQLFNSSYKPSFPLGQAEYDEIMSKLGARSLEAVFVSFGEETVIADCIITGEGVKETTY